MFPVQHREMLVRELLDKVVMVEYLQLDQIIVAAAEAEKEVLEHPVHLVGQVVLEHKFHQLSKIQYQRQDREQVLLLEEV
jgi:hypothetical protein